MRHSTPVLCAAWWDLLCSGGFIVVRLSDIRPWHRTKINSIFEIPIWNRTGWRIDAIVEKSQLSSELTKIFQKRFHFYSQNSVNITKFKVEVERFLNLRLSIVMLYEAIIMHRNNLTSYKKNYFQHSYALYVLLKIVNLLLLLKFHAVSLSRLIQMGFE